jgi:hypothetical protein
MRTLYSISALRVVMTGIWRKYVFRNVDIYLQVHKMSHH